MLRDCNPEMLFMSCVTLAGHLDFLDMTVDLCSDNRHRYFSLTFTVLFLPC